MANTALPTEQSLAREGLPYPVRITLLGSLGLALVGVLAAIGILRGTDSIFELPVFFHQFVVHDLPGSLLSAGILLIALFSFRRVSVSLHALDCLDRYRYLIAAALAVLLAVGTLTIYHNHPLSVDEFAQLFQAKIFAKGRIWTTYPPELLDWLLPFTRYGFFRPGWVTGQVICDYWPGLSLLQAPFVLIGAPWLLNPLLGAGALLLIRRLATELYPDTNAPAWAMLFALASPAFIINSLSYYSLPALLFLNLLFTVLILRGTPRMLFAAGVVGSLALIQKNPLPHVSYAMPWIVWLLARRGGWRALVWLAIGYAPLSLLVGVGWALLRADLASQAPAEGNTVYEAPWRLLSIFSAKAFLATLFCRVLGFLKLAAWAVPGLIVLAILGARTAWKDARVRALAACMLVSFAGYLLFTVTQGHGWGYRHVHGAWAVLPLLACGAVAGRKDGVRPTFTPVSRLAVISILLSLIFLNGLRLYQVDAWMDRHLAQLPPLDPDRKQVCFIRPWEGYYSVDLVQNDPFLRQRAIVLKSHGLETEEPFMANYFPDASRESGGPNGQVWNLKPR